MVTAHNNITRTVGVADIAGHCMTKCKMVFLTNEFTKKAEITILSARESTRPGLQAGALWVERKAYIRGSVARDSHVGL